MRANHNKKHNLTLPHKITQTRPAMIVSIEEGEICIETKKGLAYIYD